MPPEVCRAFKRRLLNIHPGLLPAFGGKGCYGERVHKAVIESGARCVGLLLLWLVLFVWWWCVWEGA